MVSASKVRGVGPAMEKALSEHGFTSAEDIAAATPTRLKGVPGIGAATAPRLIASAKALLADEIPVSDEKPRPSGKSQSAGEIAQTAKKKAAKLKKAFKKAAKKLKDKIKKKDKGKSAKKGGKKKSKKGKSSKKS